jgi:hypothetical protein
LAAVNFNKMDGKKEAIVIMVGDRFFSDYKKKRILNAWSLASAKLFLDGCGGKTIEYYEGVLQKKGYKTERKLVKLVV